MANQPPFSGANDVAPKDVSVARIEVVVVPSERGATGASVVIRGGTVLGTWGLRGRARVGRKGVLYVSHPPENRLAEVCFVGEQVAVCGRDGASRQY